MRTLFSACLALALATGAWAAQGGATAAGNQAVDQRIAATLQREYARRPDLAKVKASVSQQIVTLSGTVPNYRAELNAIHTARQQPAVNGFIDHLRVVGPTVADAKLQKHIAQRLVYDRIGMGQTFNDLDVRVHHGVVTISGHVRDYPDRDSALDIAANTRGVKRVLDRIQVAPLSPFDDQIRLEAAERIYRNPEFHRYAINPAHPIRILVTHGNVTLSGVVTSKVDKQMAATLVRGLPNVFKVTNDLKVVG